MTSNALAVLTQGEIEQTELDEIYEEESLFDEYSDGDFIPPRLTVAGGGAKAFVDENDEMIKSPISCIVLGAVKTRGTWLLEDVKVPFCSSIGGVFGTIKMNFSDAEFEAATRFAVPHLAVREITEKQPLSLQYDCATCALNKFGTGKNGGKACNEKRRLLVLFDGWTSPAILDVPVMSLRNWDSYKNTLRTRMSTRYYAVRTKIDVEKVVNSSGQDYGKMTFSLIEKITDVTMARAIADLRKELAEVVIKQPLELETEDAIELDATPAKEEIPF